MTGTVHQAEGDPSLLECKARLKKRCKSDGRHKKSLMMVVIRRSCGRGYTLGWRFVGACHYS